MKPIDAGANTTSERMFSTDRTVELAHFGRPPQRSKWELLREAQTRTLQLENTGIAVTMDMVGRIGWYVIYIMV